jgi:uncharacterized protein YbjT (DUF2867 family)
LSEDGDNRVQPVLVIDVAAGITACIRDQGFSMGKTFELGGPDVFTINELVHFFATIPFLTHMHVHFQCFLSPS